LNIFGKIINKPIRGVIANTIFTEHGEISDSILIADNFFLKITNIESSLAKTIGTTSVDYAIFFPPSQINSAVFEQTDNQEILNVINSLNNTNSTVDDDIPSMDPLSKLIYNYMENGVFHFPLHYTDIRHQYKLYNYRDINIIILMSLFIIIIVKANFTIIIIVKTKS